MGWLSFLMKTDQPTPACPQVEPDLDLWSHLVQVIKTYLENDPVFRYSVAVGVISIVLVTCWMVSRCVRRRSPEDVMLNGIPAQNLVQLLGEHVKKLQEIVDQLKQIQNPVVEEAPAIPPRMEAITESEEVRPAIVEEIKIVPKTTVAQSEEVRPSIVEEIKTVPKKAVAVRKTAGQVKKPLSFKREK